MLKVIAFALALLLHLGAAAAGLFFLLVAMNGYAERHATPGLLLYVVVNFGGAMGLGLGSALLIRRLVERGGWSGVTASLVTALGATTAGALLLAASFFAAILLAEALRGA